MEPDIAPMRLVFDLFDKQHIDWTTTQYEKNAFTNIEPYYYKENPFQPSDIKVMGQLLIDELNWRKKHHWNIVASCHGLAGSGKSRGTCYFGWLIGTIWGVPFVPQNIYYLPNELDQALSKREYGKTYMKDEHQELNVGILSQALNRSLSDYENQLREDMVNLLFCSVREKDHSAYLKFEALYPVFGKKNGEPYPDCFIFLLRTPRLGHSDQHVARGLVSFLMPSEEFDNEYKKIKDEHLANLRKKYGNNLDFLTPLVAEVLELHEKELMEKTKQGFYSPLSNKMIESKIIDYYGTMRTRETTSIMVERIKYSLTKKYESVNEKLRLEKEKQKQKTLVDRELKRQVELREQINLQHEKMELKKIQLAELKRRNDLNEQAALLRQKTPKMALET